MLNDVTYHLIRLYKSHTGNLVINQDMKTLSCNVSLHTYTCANEVGTNQIESSNYGKMKANKCSGGKDDF